MARLIGRFRPISRHSLGGQVMSLLGTTLLITLLTFAASVFYFVYHTEETAWQSRQGEAARNAAGTVAAVIQRAQNTLEVVSILDADILKSHRDELERLLKQNPTLEEVIRLDTNGHVFVNAYNGQPVLAELITIPQSQWFLNARSGQSYFGPVQQSFDDQPYLLMAIPAPDGGVVAARVRMNILWDAVRDIRFGNSGRAYVVTREGKIVAHTNLDVVIASMEIQERTEFVELLAAPNNEWFGTYTNFEGNRVVGATAPVPGTDWAVITELPLEEAFTASRMAAFLLGAEAIFLMLIMSFTVARFVRLLIVKPMGQLRDGANRIGQGDLNHRIGLIRKDEIGQLASAFDTMASRLQQREGQVAAQTTALQMNEARYRAIVEDQTELICRFHQDGTLTFVNEAYCRYFGKERQDFIGHSFMPLIPDEDWHQVEAAFTSLTAFNPVISHEHRVIKPDGSLRWNYWTNRAILDSDGRIIEFAAVGRDITEQRRATDELRHINEELERRVEERTADLKQINDKLNFEIVEHKRAKEQLVQAEDKFRSLVEKIPAAVFSWELGENGACRYISPQIEKMLGFSVEEWLTDPQLWKKQLHPDDLERALANDADALETGRLDPIEYRLMTRDGRAVWVRDEAVVLPHEPGQPRLNFGLLANITEKKLSEERIESSLREKEVLLKEIHHRVKNNLQIISSLLNLQANQITDPRTLQALQDSQTRVRSMALIHEKLYQSQSLAKIDFGEYVKSLTGDLFRSYKRSFTAIQLTLQVDEVFLDLDQAAPCGLILNELITNALKYAFPDGRNGTINIELRAIEHTISLGIADDGVGLPAGLDVLNTKSLGLQLVNSLVAQLDGRLEVEHLQGTVFRISFEY